MGLITAGRGALADRAALQGDAPSVEAGPIGVDPDGRAAVAAVQNLCPPSSFALVPHHRHGEIVSFQPITARFMEDKSPGRTATGPSWGRETAVNNGQPRCPTDNQPPQLVSRDRP
jgi:hypothetical protein